MPEPRRCQSCGRMLDVAGDPHSEDCGGDCLACMAEAGDPECATAVKAIESRLADRGREASDYESFLRPTIESIAAGLGMTYDQLTTEWDQTLSALATIHLSRIARDPEVRERVLSWTEGYIDDLRRDV